MLSKALGPTCLCGPQHVGSRCCQPERMCAHVCWLQSLLDHGSHAPARAAATIAWGCMPVHLSIHAWTAVSTEMPGAGEAAKALLDFNATLQGVAEYVNASGGPGWGGQYAPACEWRGVQCDGAGHVTGINMSGWGVAGIRVSELGPTAPAVHLTLHRCSRLACAAPIHIHLPSYAEAWS